MTTKVDFSMDPLIRFDHKQKGASYIDLRSVHGIDVRDSSESGAKTMDLVCFGAINTVEGVPEEEVEKLIDSWAEARG